MAAQALQARATLDTLAEERESLEVLRADVQKSIVELHQAREETTEATAGLSAMRETASGLVTAEEQLRAVAKQARQDSEGAVAAVREVESKLAGLARLQ